MRVLVTGAAGFLGSHLCDRLLGMGYTVIGMDNMVTGSATNLAHLDGNPKFCLVQHDVRTFIDGDGALENVLSAKDGDIVE